MPVEQEVQHIGTDEKETMLRFFTSAETCKKPVLLLCWIGKNPPNSPRGHQPDSGEMTDELGQR
jgi:hypothetical protein